jgi:hypothetical protein
LSFTPARHRKPPRSSRTGRDAARRERTRTAPDAGPQERTRTGPDAGPQERTRKGPDAGPRERARTGPDAGPQERARTAPDAGPQERARTAPDAGPQERARTAPDAGPRERTPSSITSWLRDKPALIAAAVVAGLLALLSAWPAAAHWLAGAANTAWANEADALGFQYAARLGAQASQQPEIVSSGVAIAPHYLNPLRAVGGLVLERIDQGVDFSGAGPVYALGNGVVTSATAYSPGWSGGWITYRLTDGPAQGLMVYVAEDITPTVQVGQLVTPWTVVGNMFDGAEGIETGWAQPSGATAESQLPEAGGIGGLGPFPTEVGTNFDELLQSLGVPAAPNFGQISSGLLPPNYPTAWG